MLDPLHVPKSCRQARSPKARPPPLPPPRRQGSYVLWSREDGSYNTTPEHTDQGSDDPAFRHGEEKPEFVLFGCHMPWNEEHKGSMSMEVPVVEDASFNQKDSLDSFDNGGFHSSSHVNTYSPVGSLPLITEKSTMTATGNAVAWLSPGNVVWAKTNSHKWWPAEVMDKSDTLECFDSLHIEHVLVKLYGSHKYEWLDPAEGLSQFEHCYEERSSNPLEAFQDALKQALCKCKQTISGTVLTSELKSSIQQDQPFDTLVTPSSSGMEDDCSKEGRGKRKRKLKPHFDELTFPRHPARRTRRLRIMRQLGLAAPVGSPFLLSRERSA